MMATKASTKTRVLEKRYSIKSFDFTRQWEKDAKITTGLTKRQILNRVEKILEQSTAPKIEIQLWRDAK